MRQVKFVSLLLVTVVILTGLTFSFNAAPVAAQDPFLGWHWDAPFAGYVLDGVQDGNNDIQVNETNPSLGPILLGIRGGAPAKFTTSVPGKIISCMGEILVNGVKVDSKTNCDGRETEVQAGEIVIRKSTGPTGGFRWTPKKDAGWQVGASQGCPPQDGICWERQPDGSYKWTGAVDGSADVHQASHPEALAWIRQGGSVTLQTTVPMQVVGTCHVRVTLNGVLIEERHDCGKINTPIKVGPGTLVLDRSTTDQGGWRLSPQEGYGWRAPAPTSTPVPYSTTSAATPTMTLVKTFTPTRSFTATPTKASVVFNSPTSTRTSTATPTRTLGITPSSTPTTSPTGTATPTPSPSPTATTIALSPTSYTSVCGNVTFKELADKVTNDLTTDELIKVTEALEKGAAGDPSTCNVKAMTVDDIVKIIAKMTGDEKRFFVSLLG